MILRNMETNTCHVNHLVSDVLLPPRKRLLAGLKRQSSNVHSPVSLSPPPRSVVGENNVDDDINRCLVSNPTLSEVEIAEASRTAAIEAAKVAESARANAEEKAAKAVKAVAAAKSALELVAALSEETVNREKILKKRKMKKHVPVEALYSRSKSNANCSVDEELARKLHLAISSSPKISKTSSGSDLKDHIHKRLKRTPGEGTLPSTTAAMGNKQDSRRGRR